jgi:hypothetical protein
MKLNNEKCGNVEPARPENIQVAYPDGYSLFAASTIIAGSCKE